MSARFFLLCSFLTCAAAAGATPEVTIVLPYAGAGQLAAYWAASEQKVDWQQAGEDAERCTVAFAAVELRNFLARTAPSLELRYADKVPAGGQAIVVGPIGKIRRNLHLDAGAALEDPQGYTIRTLTPGGTLVLAGGGREGTLYAVYRYLNELGWRWYAPGKNGEVAPAAGTAVKLEGWNLRTTPDFPLFRGFHTGADIMESADLFTWMARNGLNAWGYRPRTAALLRKLGFRFVTGGHVLEDVMNPDAPQPDGRTLFEAHQEWFPEVDGKRERKNAARYQFCVSNDQASDFVARSIVEHFRTDWGLTDYQNVWMLDTWAGWCQCARCRTLGNDADRYLHFLSRVRKEIDQARKAGVLTRNYGMALAAYEGTPALAGPTAAVPGNLTSGVDYSLYAPINRCYAHTLEDPRCTEINARYARAVESWGKVSNKFPLAVVEYYNVSKFEDLPLLFSRTMGADFAYYRRIGVTGMSYMHIPMVLWGPRTLTQTLFARLSWNSTADVEPIKQEYLKLYYGPAAGAMRDFYDSLETAWANVTAWRSWSSTSVMWRMLHWETDPPTRPLFPLKHLQPEGGQAIGQRESLEKLEQAGAALQRALEAKISPVVRRRIEEDSRAFRYADDSFRFYVAMTRLYLAEQHGDEAGAKRAWVEVKRWVASLSSYYVPFEYEEPGPGIRVQDALTRTQLRPLIDRLREKYDQAQ